MQPPGAKRPGADEYAPYYERYVSLVPEGDVVRTLGRQLDETLALLGTVPEGRGGERYEPGKWSLKEVVGHIIDTERVFAYRALTIARGDTSPLPGMDQDVFMSGANFAAYTLGELAEEFAHVRRASVSLIGHLDEAAWGRRGTASDNEVSVRALAHILAGHAAHHLNIIRTRYLGAEG